VACSADWGGGSGVYRFLVWKPEGKIPLGRPSHRWEDNIRMYVSRDLLKPLSYHPFDATAKYRQRTEHARNVTGLPTFDTLRGHESRPHCHDTVLRYAVTLQVCTYHKASARLGASVPEDGGRTGFRNVALKNLDDGRIPKKRVVSGSHALSSNPMLLNQQPSLFPSSDTHGRP
jgi:hypothetical protein